MKPVILAIMDGLGINSGEKGNAVLAAKTPFLDKMFAEYPSTEIGASGLSVGLPDGQMGNSEVGHLNMGAGRVVYQDFTRINQSVDSREIFTNPAILASMGDVRESGSTLHIIGLLSDGGVHSHINHLFALIDMAKNEGLERVFIHAFMDGRDTPPRSGTEYIKKLEDHLEKTGVGKIATVMGRFYAMDRDSRWGRVEEAYRAMVEGSPRRTSSAMEAMELSYAEDKGDEFVPPTSITKGDDPPHLVRDNDAIIFFNFRSDRAREITRVFTERDFSEFKGVERPVISNFVCMTQYDAAFDLPQAFPPASMGQLLGDVISGVGMKQLRIAETEKYAHVTFFFNGGMEEHLPGEDRILIPSPKEVRTYDEKPSMSAVEVTDLLLKKLSENKYDLVVLNYANCDMVGHTGVFNTAVEAVETVDSCLERVVTWSNDKGYCVLITADHGNAEQMIDERTGGPHTAHTTNPVPFIIADPEMRGVRLRQSGKLADVAPTILHILGVDKPEQMDGRSLIEFD